MKLKLRRSRVDGYVCGKWPTAKGSRPQIIVLHVFGLMRKRIAGWLSDSTVIENWLSLMVFFQIFNSNFISSPLLFSSRSHRYAYSHYDRSTKYSICMFDEVRCRLESNRIFISDHQSSSTIIIIWNWPYIMTHGFSDWITISNVGGPFHL